MDLYLQDKAAIVTGASQGLGRAIALELAREGVRVFATGRNEALLSSLAEEARASNAIVPVTFVQDFAAADAPQRIAHAACQALGHVDILVNNAGGTRPVEIDAGDDRWEEAMTLNFDRHRQLTQQLLGQFIARKQGSILNISGSYEMRAVNAAGVAKAGLTAWSKGLSHQIGRHGITVNCLQPGFIDTQQIRQLFTPAARASYASQEIALGDFGVPQDIANMAVFLVSPRARYVTGSVAVVDGGKRHHAF